MAAIYAAFFVSPGLYVPFMPVWLEQRGFSLSDIALLGALPLIVRTVLSTTFTYLVDARMQRRLALIVLNGIAAIIMALLHVSAGFWTVAGLVIVLALCLAAATSLVEASAMRVVRVHNANYGHMRLWGSLSFMAATVLGGFAISAFGSTSLLVLIAFAHLGVMVIAALIVIPPRGDTPNPQVPAPADVANWRMLTRPAFLSVLLIVALMQSSHAVYYTYSTLHWQRLGYSTGTIGSLWAVGIIAEIILFVWSKPLLTMTGPRRLLILAAGGAIVRWSLTAFDPPLPLLAFAQVLHCMSFGLVHLATISFISRTTRPELVATAQSLTSALTGAAMALATLAAGALFTSFAAKAYLAMAALGVAAALGLGVIRLVIPAVEESAP